VVGVSAIILIDIASSDSASAATQPGVTQPADTGAVLLRF